MFNNITEYLDRKKFEREWHVNYLIQFDNAWWWYGIVGTPAGKGPWPINFDEPFTTQDCRRYQRIRVKRRLIQKPFADELMELTEDDIIDQALPTIRSCGIVCMLRQYGIESMTPQRIKPKTPYGIERRIAVTRIKETVCVKQYIRSLDPEIKDTTNMSTRWPTNAEEYCRNERKVDKIIHQDDKYLYNLTGLRADTVVALFDKEGFLVIKLKELQSHWGRGYFPDSIKAFSGYVAKELFEAMATKAAAIKRAVESSGKSVVIQQPDRTTTPDTIMMMMNKWDHHGGKCFICNSPIDLEADNPMLKIARGMLDANRKSYDYDNTIIGHYSCILAKNHFSMEQVAEWRDRVINGIIREEEE